MSIKPNGDIIAKRLSKANVFVHRVPNELNDQRTVWSNSSSDVYAMNSEAGDLYGVALASKPYSGSQDQRDSRETSFFPRLISKKKNESHRVSSNGQNARAFSSSGASSSSSGLVSSFANSKRQNNSTKASDVNVGQGDGYTVADECRSISLGYNKPVKLFDMDKFRAVLKCESRKPCPNHRYLQRRCITIASFVVDDKSILNLPSWIMIINMVAMDLLRAEFGYFEFDSMTLKQPGPMTDTCRLALCPGPFRSDESNSRSPLSSEVSDQFIWNSGREKQTNKSRTTSERTTSNGYKCGSEIKRPNMLAHAANAQQQSSSSTTSSGFDSNCSSQKDSSPSGSSTNIHQNMDGKKTGKVEQSIKERSNITNVQKGNQMVLPDLRLDGKSANKPKGEVIKGTTAKLLSATSNHMKSFASVSSLTSKLNGTGVSDPIKIPPPPSSSQTGPSGSANLILVSPTGLSPPLVKRKGFNRGQDGIGRTGISKLASAYQMPEFDTIKHIDENGKCSLLKVQRDNTRVPKLPVGIPPHAKLAPPATQKHIIRYLISANKGNYNNLSNQYNISDMSLNNNSNQQMKRPLPIVPTQKRQQQVHDETLYYRGLQVRVPMGRPMRRMDSEPNFNSSNDPENFENLALSYYQRSRPLSHLDPNLDLNQLKLHEPLSSRLLKLDVKSIVSRKKPNNFTRTSSGSLKSMSMNNLSLSTNSKSLINSILPFSLLKKKPKDPLTSS